MKTLFLMACAATLSMGTLAMADDKASPPAQPSSAGAPAMSEIPTMKEQGERMAVLMEKLTKETDPAERKRIMAEAVCPQ